MDGGDCYDDHVMSMQNRINCCRYSYGSPNISSEPGYFEQFLNNPPLHLRPSSPHRYYDSDQVDSDIEEALYSSIHHQTVNTQELSFSRMNSGAVGDGGGGDLANVNNNKIEDEDSHNLSSKSDDSVQFIEQSPKNNNNNLVVVVNKRKSIKMEQTKQRKQKRLEERKSGAKRTSNCNLMTDGLFGALQSKVNGDSEDLDLSYGNGIDLDGFDLMEHMNKFYNEDNYNSDEERKTVKKMNNNKRFWQVDEKDILSRFMSRSSSHYRPRFKECNICFQPGHVSRDCPTKKKLCYICGETDHQSSWCRNKMCSSCFGSGHFSNQCKLQMNQFTCSICKLTGHSENKCTFNWRKFLTITDYSVPVNESAIQNSVTVNNRVSCYNCGMNGSHFGHECTSLTINRKRFEIPSPILNMKRKKMHSYQSTPSKRLRTSPSSSSSANYSDLYAPSEDLPRISSRTPTRATKPIQNGGYRSDSSVDFLDSDDSVNYAINLLKQSTSSSTSTPPASGRITRSGGGGGNKRKSPKTSPKSQKKKNKQPKQQQQSSMNINVNQRSNCRYNNNNNKSDKQVGVNRRKELKQLKKVRKNSPNNNKVKNNGGGKKTSKKVKGQGPPPPPGSSTKKKKKKSPNNKNKKQNSANNQNNKNKTCKYWSSNNLFS